MSKKAFKLKPDRPDTCEVCASTRVHMKMTEDCQVALDCQDCGHLSRPPALLTEEDIEAGKTPKGGFSRATLAKWGVPWPPPKGWKEALLNGESVLPKGKPTADELLREVCLAVIEAGQGKILHGLPDVLDHFGGRLPNDAEIAASKRTLRSDTDGLPW
jgi:hypothetical protein